jgi:DNA methylase
MSWNATIAIRAAIESDYSVSGITMPAITVRCRNLGASERSNLWTIKTAASDDPQQDFISGYLAEPTSLPTGTNAKGLGRTLGNVRVTGGRNSALYLAHSYHTKVPPEAITPFIEHYTKPGDVILDPFCGSGMTGVAAAMAGRQCILSDLSPAAIHLAWNHTRPCDPKKLGEAFSEISERLGPQFSNLYRTEHTDGTVATIHWTLWSTRHNCPECKKDFLLWEAMDRETGRLGKTIDCPRCHDRIKRSGLKTVGSEPAWLSYETTTGKRFANEPNARDLKRTLGFTRADIGTWFPETAIGADREMYTPTPEYRADPDSVRAELYKILAEARAAQRLPWEPKTVLLYRTIFPQMTNWLPDEEAAQLRFEFEAEIKRLEAA